MSDTTRRTWPLVLLALCAVSLGARAAVAQPRRQPVLRARKPLALSARKIDVRKLTDHTSGHRLLLDTETVELTPVPIERRLSCRRSL